MSTRAPCRLIAVSLRATRIAFRRTWKRLRHPLVFRTPVVYPLFDLAHRLFFDLRFLRRKFKRFHQAPVDSREKWWNSLDASRLTQIDFVLPSRQEIIEECASIREATGCWPISFSYPRSIEMAQNGATVRKRNFFSDIIPGRPYSFDDEGQYLRQYGNAYFALTHKKGGWDCFRHLEILATGCFPLMPDVSDVPSFTMVHYPKKAMAQIVDELPQLALADSSNLERLAEFVRENLTTQAMVRYISEAVGIERDSRVLFVDEALKTKADYLSIFTLVGLKQLYGRNVTESSGVDYLYEDFTGDTKGLYGRGFGYSRVLSRSCQNSLETRIAEIPDLSDKFDFIVVGSIARNYDLAQSLLQVFPSEKTVWIHGEDKPPTRGEIAEFLRPGVHLFVRELSL